ncbi:DUF2913 family protein [Photobacterium lutimaris]|uniref:DUF2913 domain-containing protein n=1 Tax=Photobacterium lutimaris TaxID=388278 RepID=A0A2T3ITS1_9GAMM|nr:DUF2913 family protein [Photobacterium lutimaris]PSU31765.1 hypothetical protein C9I99_21515 [Photobacterium lutimaris]TDR72584.1 DUF2913 family protein [Photobacterium lutimaris]
MSYATQVEQLASNSLLHLEMQKKYSKTHITIEKRNQILVKYLKGLEKKPDYKLAKKVIKSLIQTGRKKGKNIESRLEALLVLEKPEGNNTLEKFYFLVKDIERQLNTTVNYSTVSTLDLSKLKSGCLVCIMHANLYESFDAELELISPLKWRVKATPAKLQTLKNILDNNSTFASHYREIDDQLEIILSKRTSH